MFGLWNWNSHYYFFLNSCNYCKLHSPDIISNGIQNGMNFRTLILNIIIALSIPFWTTACPLIHRSFEFLLDPFLTLWYIYWSIAPSIAPLVTSIAPLVTSIAPLVTSIAHSFAPWSIACFLSFSDFYINRSFYCSPILRLLPDP